MLTYSAEKLCKIERNGKKHIRICSSGNNIFHYRKGAVLCLQNSAFALSRRGGRRHLLGAEGVGIYQICLSVFSVFLTMASSGIPVTVSRMIAKQSATGTLAGKHAVVSAGVAGTLLFTVPAAIILFFGRGMLSFLFPDGDSIDIFVILLPGLILTSVYAVMRGTFWGNKQFMPYSLIELAEDSVMVILGSILVMFASSPSDGAFRATVAVLISYIFSFIVSVGWYLAHGGKFVHPREQLLRKAHAKIARRHRKDDQSRRADCRNSHTTAVCAGRRNRRAAVRQRLQRTRDKRFFIHADADVHIDDNYDRAQLDELRSKDAHLLFYRRLVYAGMHICFDADCRDILIHDGTCGQQLYYRGAQPCIA